MKMNECEGLKSLYVIVIITILIYDNDDGNDDDCDINDDTDYCYNEFHSENTDSIDIDQNENYLKK